VSGLTTPPPSPRPIQAGTSPLTQAIIISVM
jgi:hypothetical protein